MKNKKLIASYAFFCSATILTSKIITKLQKTIITKITENHSEFSAWAHNFNKSV